MKILTATVALSALLFAGAASSDEALVKSLGCAGCHDIAKKKVGPTWKEIAAKSTEADMIAVIQKGGKGKYGKVPMPPQAKAKGKEADIAKWIASLK